MNNKPFKRAERLEKIYDNKHWELLREIRLKSIDIMEKLNSFHIKSVVHGSIARGDVSKTSDIDIYLSVPPSSFLLENILERNNLKIYSRKIIQATPSYALKGYIELDPYCSLSFPLVKLRDIEKNIFLGFLCKGRIHFYGFVMFTTYGLFQVCDCIAEAFK